MAAKKWTPEVVVAEIKSMAERKEDLSARHCYLDHSRLFAAASKRFGSWERAIIAAGIDYDSIRKQHKEWTRDSIIQEILSLQENNENLNQAAIRKINNGLVQAARKHFGGWDEALRASEVDPDQYRKRKSPGYWSKARIIQEIQNLQSKHSDLDTSNLRKEIGNKRFSVLNYAACKEFGGWYAALRAAGLDPDEHRILRPSGFWTKETVIDEIKRLKASDIDLHYPNIKKNYVYLDVASQRKFGGWGNALAAAGIDPSQYLILKPRGYWSRARIISDIKVLEGQGESLNYISIFHELPALIHAATDKFGGWYPAIEAAGFDSKKYRKQKPSGYWSKERVLQQLKEYVEENGSLDLMLLKAPHLLAAISKFGGIKSIARESNLDYRVLLSHQEWSKERIIKDIQQLHDMGEDLSAINIQNLEPRLIGIAPSYFGSWKGAIKAAGYDYDRIRRDWIFESFRGSKFEEYVEIVLDKVGWKVKHHKIFTIDNQSYQPDFYDPNTENWIDAKLDAGSYTTHLTIQKYLPFANKVIIIYLKGKPRKRDSDYAQFIPISQFYEELRNIGLDDMIKKLELLKHKQLRPEIQKDFHDFIRKENPADKKSLEQILDHVSA